VAGVESAEDRGEADDGWRRWNVRLAPGVAPGDVLERCVAEQFPLRQFEQMQASLHDVFVHIVGSAEASQ
jgi:ABC-2 type transport system ATP-binding protein